MRTTLSALCLTLIVACGGATDPNEMNNEASSALSSGRYSEALTGFEAVLAKVDASHPAWMRAKMGSIEARIHIDPDQAQAEFLAFAAANEGQVGEKDYRSIGSKMTSAGKYLQAIAVVDAGIKKFGESEVLTKTMDAIKRESKNDAAAQDALAGLGYL